MIWRHGVGNNDDMPQVFLATIRDDSYGHLAEAIKQSVGEEHEQRLKDILTRLQLPFSDEHLLR